MHTYIAAPILSFGHHCSNLMSYKYERETCVCK